MADNDSAFWVGRVNDVTALGKAGAEGYISGNLLNVRSLATVFRRAMSLAIAALGLELTGRYHNEIVDPYGDFLDEAPKYLDDYDNFMKTLDKLNGALDNAAEVGGYELRAIYYDPLVLDLNHNGVIDTVGIGRGWSALH